jgi:hypothetical protein
LDGVGTPLGVLGGGGVGGFFDLAGFFLLGFDCGCLTFLPACPVPGLSGVGFCPFPDPFGVDVGDVFLVVVVGLLVVEEPWAGFGLGVVDPGCVVEGEVDVEVVCAGVVVVTVAAGVVAVAGGHDCETLVIGRFTGSGSELGGVPGGTFWKVKV